MTWPTDFLPPAFAWLFLAIVLVNAARMVQNNSEKWWDFVSGDWRRIGLGREECPYRHVGLCFHRGMGSASQSHHRVV